MSPAWRKQCCYCHHVILDDGEADGAEAQPGLWLVPSRQEDGRVSHGICGPCFERKIAALREGAAVASAAGPSGGLRRSS